MPSRRLAYPNEVELSPKLRRQVAHILMRCLGLPERRQLYGPDAPSVLWGQVFQDVCAEEGTFSLGQGDSPAEQCLYCLTDGNPAWALNVIELAVRARMGVERRPRVMGSLEDITLQAYYVHRTPDGREAMFDINQRLREAGAGFAFAEERLLSTASDYTHSRMVEPALVLLREEGFEGAHDEFLRANRQLRAGEYPAAITEACKAFESTMKTVCARKGWQSNPGDKPVESLTVQPLVNFLKGKGFFPQYLDNAMSGLVNLLGAGVNTVRNQSGHSHGQGEKVVSVDRHLAEYAVHQAAANILFLVRLFSPR